MESLTKENFWNELAEKYPEQMKQFGLWIDEYKKRVGWHNLFHLDNPNAFQGGPSNFKRKYHELPIAMQFGIFYQFTVESEEYDLFYQDVAVPKTMDDINDCIEGFFFLQKMKA